MVLSPPWQRFRTRLLSARYDRAMADGTAQPLGLTDIALVSTETGWISSVAASTQDGVRLGFDLDIRDSSDITEGAGIFTADGARTLVVSSSISVQERKPTLSVTAQDGEGHRLYNASFFQPPDAPPSIIAVEGNALGQAFHESIDLRTDDEVKIPDIDDSIPDGIRATVAPITPLALMAVTSNEQKLKHHPAWRKLLRAPSPAVLIMVAAANSVICVGSVVAPVAFPACAVATAINNYVQVRFALAHAK